MTTEEYFNKIDLEKLKQEIAEIYRLSRLIFSYIDMVYKDNIMEK